MAGCLVVGGGGVVTYGRERGYVYGSANQSPSRVIESSKGMKELHTSMSTCRHGIWFRDETQLMGIRTDTTLGNM